jgi:hypothetical protein
MRKTTYVSGYGYITQYGSGWWQDAGSELVGNIGKRVVGAIGDKIGRKLADKIVGKKILKKNPYSDIRESVLKEIKVLPYEEKEYGLSDDVRKALYGSGIRKVNHLI